VTPLKGRHAQKASSLFNLLHAITIELTVENFDLGRYSQKSASPLKLLSKTTIALNFENFSPPAHALAADKYLQKNIHKNIKRYFECEYNCAGVRVYTNI